LIGIQTHDLSVLAIKVHTLYLAATVTGLFFLIIQIVLLIVCLKTLNKMFEYKLRSGSHSCCSLKSRYWRRRRSSSLRLL